MYCIYGTFFKFVRAHAVYASHEDITEGCTESKSVDHVQVNLESRINLDTAKIKGYDGNLLKACFLKSSWP